MTLILMSCSVSDFSNVTEDGLIIVRIVIESGIGPALPFHAEKIKKYEIIYDKKDWLWIYDSDKRGATLFKKDQIRALLEE